MIQHHPYEYIGLQSFLLQYPESGKVVRGLAVLEKSAGQWLEEAKAAVFE